jgi:hypothetical protein
MGFENLMRARDELREVQRGLRAKALAEPGCAVAVGMLIQRCEDAQQFLYGVLLGLDVMLGDQRAHALLTGELEPTER